MLQQRYREAMGASEAEPFPLESPANAKADGWKQFSSEQLGFVPSASSSDEELWQEFLARRYHHPSALNDAYKRSKPEAVGSFVEEELPEELPADGAQLIDWYQFESIVLAMKRLAHRFIVLIPLAPSEGANAETQRQRLELAQRIVQLQKPAHTAFEVKSYWALFRVGMVRLGSDTILDVGSRSPYLVSSMVLGQGYLLESYLAPGHPQNVPDRTILGRDRLKT
jgi:hypothetical protein